MQFGVYKGISAVKKSEINKFPPRVVLWGGTGQAKVVRPIIEYYGGKVVAVFDDTPDLPPPFSDVPVYCGRKGFEKWLAEQDGSDIGFSITIGNPHGRVRLKLHDLLINDGLKPITVAHPAAWIADNATIGEGSHIHAGAVVEVEARIGRCCIINTKASVDHEGIIEDGCELAPGATLCGNVHMKINSWVCAGATVLPRIQIGEDSIVGAGAVVISNVPDRTTVVGIPAKNITKN